MKQTGFQSGNPLLILVLLILVAITLVQTWYMSDMKSRLDTLQTATSQAKPAAPAAPAVTSRHDHRPDTRLPENPSPGKRPPENRAAESRPLDPVTDNPAANDPPRSPLAPSSPSPFSGWSDFGTPAWNPYEEIQRMQRDMDRIFNHTFRRFGNDPVFQHFFDNSVTVPEIDIQEDDRNYIVIVNLPGSNEENITVHLDGRVLTIEGEQSHSTRNRDATGNIIFQERRSGAFQRSITLPGPVKQAAMKTDMKNGVLVITLPKQPPL